MFGYIIVNKPEMKFREFDVYHGYYCGLCKKLKQHYGKFGQITLSYDMTFVLMVLTSLYEPEARNVASHIHFRNMIQESMILLIMLHI